MECIKPSPVKRAGQGDQSGEREEWAHTVFLLQQGAGVTFKLPCWNPDRNFGRSAAPTGILHWISLHC